MAASTSGGGVTTISGMPRLLDLDVSRDAGVAVDEREARPQLRRQIARLEAELAGLFGEAFGHIESPHLIDPVAASPRVLDLGELEVIRDASRTGSRRRGPPWSSGRGSRRPISELLERMLAAPAELQVGSGVQGRHRDSRAAGTGTRNPARPDRDADGLVAGQGLLWMSLIRAACGR